MLCVNIFKACLKRFSENGISKSASAELLHDFTVTYIEQLLHNKIKIVKNDIQSPSLNLHEDLLDTQDKKLLKL